MVGGEVVGWVADWVRGILNEDHFRVGGRL